MIDDDYESEEERVTRIFHAREREAERAAEKLLETEGYYDVVDFLEAAGESLYGSRWQTSISRDLEVSDRTVRNWSARKFDIPPGVIFDLVALIQTRRTELEKVERRAGKMMERLLATRVDDS